MDLDDSSRTLSAASVQSEETLTMEQEDLSDDQIDFLLQRASLRMKARTETALDTPDSFDIKLPQLKGSAQLAEPYVKTHKGIVRVDESKLRDETQMKLAEKPKKVDDPVAVRKAKKEPKPALADWYNLPKTDLTPELKRDLQLLNMRAVLDPKRMYRKQGKLKIPEYSQVGVVVEGPTEFYSARIEKKQRKQTFVEEVLAGEKGTGRFKSKYAELQVGKRSGKKGYYKSLQQKRRRTMKGGG